MFKTNRILKPILKPQLRNGKLYKEETMVEICKGVYIGSEQDYERNKGKEEMNYINACKYPYYEKYKENHITRSDRNYEYNGNRLICNLVDADSIDYIDGGIIEECVKYIEESIKEGKKILINCNKGESRSATIGLIYMIKNNKIELGKLNEIIDRYTKIVPRYRPNLGMLSYLSKWYKEFTKA